MNQIAKYPLTAAPLSRRGFVASVTAVAGAMSLGFTVPTEAQQAASGAPTGGGTELGVWEVIHPDDIVTRRIARSERGQGTLTGLAHLVADELAADWSKLSAQYVAPESTFANTAASADA